LFDVAKLVDFFLLSAVFWFPRTSWWSFIRCTLKPLVL